MVTVSLLVIIVGRCLQKSSCFALFSHVMELVRASCKKCFLLCSDTTMERRSGACKSGVSYSVPYPGFMFPG